jgi:hypothetical protein
MTKEGAKITLANLKRYMSGGGVVDKSVNKAIDMAIEALSQPEPHWIPVTERLPGIGELVLDDSLSINWMSYRSGGKEWVFPRDVIAWMPLPEPMRLENK